MSKAFKMIIYFEGFVTYNSVIYPSAKGILDTYDIFIDISRHVECVVGIQKVIEWGNIKEWLIIKGNGMWS